MQLSEEAKRAKVLMRLLALERRHPKLDDVVCYLALAGYVREADAASGINSDVWRRDVQLRAVAVGVRHGEREHSRLHWACEKGLLPRVIELLEWNSDIEAADSAGATPLHFASSCGRLEVARELVRRGAKVAAKDKIGITPLHDASYYGHVNVARLLLDRGGDIEAEDDDGCTPLYFASDKGRLDVVQLLVARGAVVDARNEGSWTPQMIASQEGHAHVVRVLLAAGADVRARTDRNHTALHIASLHGRTDALRELLESDGAELNAQDDDGCTPLISACAEGHATAAIALLGAGADARVPNTAGNSALRCAELLVARDAGPPASGAEAPSAAQKEEQKQVVTLLKAHGAS